MPIATMNFNIDAAAQKIYREAAKFDLFIKSQLLLCQPFCDLLFNATSSVKGMVATGITKLIAVSVKPAVWLSNFFSAMGASDYRRGSKGSCLTISGIGTNALSRAISPNTAGPCIEFFAAMVTDSLDLARWLVFNPGRFEFVATFFRACFGSAMSAVNGKLLAANLARFHQIAFDILFRISRNLASARAVFRPFGRIRGEYPSHVGIAALLTSLFDVHDCLQKELPADLGTVLLSRQHGGRREAYHLYKFLTALPRHRIVYTNMGRMSRMELGA